MLYATLCVPLECKRCFQALGARSNKCNRNLEQLLFFCTYIVSHLLQSFWSLALRGMPRDSVKDDSFSTFKGDCIVFFQANSPPYNTIIFMASSSYGCNLTQFWSLPSLAGRPVLKSPVKSIAAVMSSSLSAWHCAWNQRTNARLKHEEHSWCIQPWWNTRCHPTCPGYKLPRRNATTTAARNPRWHDLRPTRVFTPPYSLAVMRRVHGFATGFVQRTREGIRSFAW
jgi:hypothetical protein